MVDVNGDVTPTFHEEIKKVDAKVWKDMSLSELFAQLEILQQRLVYAQSLQHPILIAAIQQGIDHIQNLIKKQSKNSTNIIR